MPRAHRMFSDIGCRVLIAVLIDSQSTCPRSIYSESLHSKMVSKKKQRCWAWPNLLVRVDDTCWSRPALPCPTCEAKTQKTCHSPRLHVPLLLCHHLPAFPKRVSFPIGPYSANSLSPESPTRRKTIHGDVNQTDQLVWSPQIRASNKDFVSDPLRILL